MASWNDYNDATQNPNLIPKGTIVRVRLTCQTAPNIFHPTAPKTFQFTRLVSAVSSFA